MLFPLLLPPTMSIFIFAPEFSNGLNAERRFVSNVFKVVIVDAGFLKGCHIVHCRTGGAHDLKRNRATAALAEPHVEIKPWFHAKFRRRGTIADFI